MSSETTTEDLQGGIPSKGVNLIEQTRAALNGKIDLYLQTKSSTANQDWGRNKQRIKRIKRNKDDLMKLNGQENCFHSRSGERAAGKSGYLVQRVDTWFNNCNFAQRFVTDKTFEKTFVKGLSKKIFATDQL